jgi:hypothetical protein
MSKILTNTTKLQEVLESLQNKAIPNAVETCTVTFPNFSVNPHLCYTSPTEGFVNKYFQVGNDLTITVIKDTIIYDNNRNFGDGTYIYEGQPVTALDETSMGVCLLVIHGDTIFQYADNAPE